MSTLTPAQIAAAAYRAGFRGEALTTAVAVALAESGGNPRSHNARPPDNSYGLWQINMIDGLGPGRRAEFGLHTNDALFDPAVNARAAWAISAHGTNWKPWATYTNGAYTRFLAQARAAARGRSGASTGRPTVPHAGRVVLDLAELDAVNRLFERAGDDVRHARHTVRTVGDDIEAARLALPDKVLANAIEATLAMLEEPGAGLDRVAERLERQARYAADVRRLAERADADHSHGWSAAEARRFIARHRHNPTPEQRAVAEALAASGLARHTAAPPDRLRRIHRMLELANRQHAVEHNGDNRTRYGAWYGNNGAAWCAQFVSWVFWHSHNRLPAIDGPKGFQSVPHAITYARAHHQLHRTPRLGDVFLRRDGSHTGIVTKVYPGGRFETVEGNSGEMVAHHRYDSTGRFYFWSPIARHGSRSR